MEKKKSIMDINDKYNRGSFDGDSITSLRYVME